jgi:hypothetical protein
MTGRNGTDLGRATLGLDWRELRRFRYVLGLGRREVTVEREPTSATLGPMIALLGRHGYVIGPAVPQRGPEGRFLSAICCPCGWPWKLPSGECSLCSGLPQMDMFDHDEDGRMIRKSHSYVSRRRLAESPADIVERARARACHEHARAAAAAFALLTPAERIRAAIGRRGAGMRRRRRA